MQLKSFGLQSRLEKPWRDAEEHGAKGKKTRDVRKAEQPLQLERWHMWAGALKFQEV